ncbi:hypothetical protein FJQ98_13190 [Lysinibacillus agricola]|uniref:Uncharacterized protein n=1 Tax=Lysinibacillus agricola TaxID=2590012 RepID=A0ABX7APU5_9BACI|nr:MULTISPECIES: hypothetical protein [Lysinibacillus]QQP10264.1 hypothetical protein FJQ98_13190 [Lysinibacillus agricola]
MKLARQNEAEECFLEALKLRKTKEDFSLIDSTQKALNLLNELEWKASSENPDV